MPRERHQRRWSALPGYLVTMFATFVLFATIFYCCSLGRVDEDAGALYLTPMIRGGLIDEARAACKVRLDNSTVSAAAADSCAGYLTVDKARRSNLFFWFFPAASGKADAPVVLWLQGGPGASSLYSVFNEHGPFAVDAAGYLLPRQHTWTATHSMLYVDNPVGAGYSFTVDDLGYSVDQTAVAKNLYEALLQFFTLYPEYSGNEFYAVGESYAGKYVPAVSYAIHQNNPKARIKINLKGLAIGNGLIDPANQLVYSEYLYQRRLIDENEKQSMEELEEMTRAEITAGDYRAAFFSMYTSLMEHFKMTSLRSIYNVMWKRDPIPFKDGHWYQYVQSSSARAALHVGRRPFLGVDPVFERMKYDIPLSVAPWLAELLDAGRYRVLLYSGQLDAMVPYQGTVNVARALRWTGAERFGNASRTAWMEPACEQCNSTELAGYATTYGPLTVLLIRNAGHMVPHDQPALAHSMIDRFTSGKSFN